MNLHYSTLSHTSSEVLIEEGHQVDGIVRERPFLVRDVARRCVPVRRLLGTLPRRPAGGFREVQIGSRLSVVVR